MAAIGKISPIKRQFAKEQGMSLGASLSGLGMSMFPGTKKGIVPWKERNGEYRTGLNPEALYIKKMGKEDAEQERARVTAWRDEIIERTGLDLGTKSDYYAKMFDSTVNENERATYVKLTDQSTVFNLNIPQQLITFAWLRVHPDIAPSFAAWEKGQSDFRCPYISQCAFFVDDVDFQAEVTYKQNMVIDKAINSLMSMSPTQQLKIAKLLSLPVSYNSKPELVYNLLSGYIKDETNKSKKMLNITNFNTFLNMSDENRDIRFRVKESLDFNVYRKGKQGKIYEGEQLISDSEGELIEHLSVKKHQDELLTLIKKIDNAKSVEV